MMKLAQHFWNLVRLKIAIKRSPRTMPNFFNAGLMRSRLKQTEWTKPTSSTKTCAQGMIQFSPGEMDQDPTLWVLVLAHQHLIPIFLCREKDRETTKRWQWWRRMGFCLQGQKWWIWHRMVNCRWIGLNKAHFFDGWLAIYHICAKSYNLYPWLLSNEYSLMLGRVMFEKSAG